MFMAKEEIKIAVAALLDLTLKNYSRGQIVPHEEIEKIAGKRYEGSYPTILAKWRRILRDAHKIPTWPVTNVGFKLLEHQEAAAYVPKKRNQKMDSQAKKTLKDLHTVDPFALPDHHRHNFVANEAYMQDQRERIKSHQKTNEILLRPTPTNPIRPM